MEFVKFKIEPILWQYEKKEITSRFRICELRISFPSFQKKNKKIFMLEEHKGHKRNIPKAKRIDCHVSSGGRIFYFITKCMKSQS